MYRKISAIVVSTLIALGIIAFMLFRVRDDLVTAFKHIVWGYLLLATAVCLGAWLLRGFRYKVILSGVGVFCGLLFSTGCIFVSQTANLIVPARLGDLVRVFILRHEYGSTISQGISSLVVERVFDIVTVALLGALSLFFVLDVPAWFYTIILVPLALGAAFFIFLYFSGRFVSENRYIRVILSILDQIRAVSLSLPSVLSISLQSFVIWIFDVLVCLFVAMMFQQFIPFAVVILAIVIGNLVKAVPLTPGGVGTYELSVALTFTVAGIDPAIATLIAVIDHLIKNLVTLAGGIVSIYFFGDWVIDTIRSAFRREMYGGDGSGA
ncbi:MAG TPA: lysylphosphatidylglycerol synthase transmembrane domain-containing protein [Methanoregulaceae archaeon]|nr:MAG: flippase-like domain-containing protein [Methanolinea sp.]HON81047.1 lysylphosphatidylglycerol synthase transmembrane domain-containing protein [Methanoregulaceae archaeon]HPD10246.1 lysylphosphatidylglycerol synthase transmembrane domain-containing protein [Methanoregulaceae archaeon]HRT14633.1 lysylphosphatidylglycerol synthase transmembrane domain-containing protein [Methanoregulaceae archaeon]HRU30204.1 lysylphosphatidylglycerol synthase transmembrane domain-containing protein [Meth